jgi:hypothetical protein
MPTTTHRHKTNDFLATIRISNMVYYFSCPHYKYTTIKHHFLPASRCDVVHVHLTYPVHSKERKSTLNEWINAFPILIPHSFHSPTSPTLPINTQTSSTSSPTTKPPSRARLPLLCCAMMKQHCYPRFTITFPMIYPTKCGHILPGGAPCCSLKHIWKYLLR